MNRWGSLGTRGPLPLPQKLKPTFGVWISDTVSKPTPVQRIPQLMRQDIFQH